MTLLLMILVFPFRLGVQEETIHCHNNCMKTFITYLYIFTIGLASLSALIGFWKKRKLHLNLLAGLIIISFPIEFYVEVVKKNNAWIYNPLMLIEFNVYAYFFYNILDNERIKKGVIFLILLFPFFWFFTTVYKFGFKDFNNYVFVAGSVFTSLLCLSYFYQLLISANPVKLSRHFEFWIVSGLLFFYSSVLPFFGLLNNLIRNKIILAIRVLPVIQVLDTIMYLSFTYAFLCLQSHTTKNSL